MHQLRISSHPSIKCSGFSRRMSKDEINTFPLKRWEGPVRIVASQEQMDAAVIELSQQAFLGFDTETRPAFKKGQHFQPSLLQLASAEEVFLFQLNKVRLSKKLLAIFSDPDVVKAGVALDFDLKELQGLASFKPAGFVDLGVLAKQLGIKNHGLRGLAAILLGMRLSKSSQRSNWARNILTPVQVKYAATDAWVGREIYFKMLEIQGKTEKTNA